MHGRRNSIVTLEYEKESTGLKPSAFFAYLFRKKHIYMFGGKIFFYKNFCKGGLKHFQKDKKYVTIGEYNHLNTKNRFLDYSAYTQEKNFSFAKNSSIGCGGVAKIAFCPKSLAELTSLIDRLKKDEIDYYVLGNLTNVLPPDGDTNRAIIRTKNLNGIAFTESGAFVYAGANSGAFLSACRREKKSGAEFLYGVPCTLGGALYMNAGAGGVYIDEIVESVLVLRDGQKLLLKKTDCDYAYKHSAFMENGDVILGAALRLKNASEEEISANEKHYAERRKHLPKGRSMGCVFKNPNNASAGELIEKSGFKGMRIGGAVVSHEHANFIINDNGATAGQIRSLITIIKNGVWAQYGVHLEEEIRYLE